MKNTTKGLLLVITSGVVFGIMPSAVSFCYAQGANRLIVLLFRYLALSVILLPLVIKQKNVWTQYCNHILSIFLLSLVGVGTPLLLYSAYTLLPTGVVTTIHFLYPTIVALICVSAFREKLSKLKLFCLLLCVSGMLLMLNPSGQKLNSVGILIAIASSITWALYIVFLDKLDFGDVSSTQIMFYVSINGVALSLLAALCFKSIAIIMTPVGWLALIGTSLLVSVGGSLFFAIGVRKTGAQSSAIASTLEPITSLLVGVLILKESISPLTALGSILILIAVILNTAFENKR